MAKFKLKEAVVRVRDMDVKVRELTQAERNGFITAVGVDRLCGPAMLMSSGSVDPHWTFEDAVEEPADVVEQIVDKIMELSGMARNKKELEKTKQPNAGGTLPVQSGDGVGVTSE